MVLESIDSRDGAQRSEGLPFVVGRSGEREHEDDERGKLLVRLSRNAKIDDGISRMLNDDITRPNYAIPAAWSDSR